MPANGSQRDPIAANAFQMSQLLGSDVTGFHIPRYQRSYSWTIEEVDTLLQDILHIARDTTGQVHFVGPMVFARSAGYNSLSILDGQQRFTTLMLLISIIKRYVEGLPETEQSQMLKELLAGALKITTTNAQGELEVSMRLKSNRQDADVFSGFMNQGTAHCTHDSHKLMRKAYNYLSEQVASEMEQGDPLTALKKIWQAVQAKFWYIHIVCEEEINAQAVFESLNAKALSLKSSDLIKNYLFMEIDQRGLERDIEAADNTWTMIINNLGNDGELPDFIRAYWNSRYGFVRADGLYKAVSREVSSRLGNVTDFLRSLEGEARVFAGFRTPTAEIWGRDTTVQMVAELRDLNIRVTRSVLMSLWYRLKDEPRELESVVRALRNFMIRYSKVCEMPSNVLEMEFSDWAVGLRAGTKEHGEFLSYLRDRSPSAERFVEDFRNLKIKSAKVARLLLARINDEMEGSEERTTDLAVATLEHIIPESPNDHWKRLLDEQGAVLDDVLHRVGNLTLLLGQWNSSASNRPYAEKLEDAYSRSVLAINKDLIRAHNTDANGHLLPLEQREPLQEYMITDLQKRQDRLADVAERMWTV